MSNNRKRIIYFTLLLLTAVAFVLIIRTKNNKAPGQTIREITPTLGTIQSLISTTGTVQPQNRLEIKPPINGRIEELKVLEGEKVTAGQILAWMSSTERAALLDTARAQGEESLRYWQQAYKATPLIAPINGEVIVRSVEPGQTVTSSDAVVVLSDRLIVEANVDETDIGKVKVEQKAIIGLDAYPQIKVKAKVDHISYESEIVNNVTIYKVDILPEVVPEVFRSGMSANVEIVEKGRDNTLLLPLAAVKEDKQGSFVLLNQGKNKQPLLRKVKLGISDGENIEVISGIEPQDKILIVTESYIPARDETSGGNPFMPFGRRRR
jgi:macrolide-specific efflux system membrane fusion protein